jgi:hypothetical protein
MSRLMLTVVLLTTLCGGVLLASAESTPKPKRVSASLMAPANAASSGPCTTGTTYAASFLTVLPPAPA